MNIAKIVFIGAGSMFFGLSMFRDLFSSGEFSVVPLLWWISMSPNLTLTIWP